MELNDKSEYEHAESTVVEYWYIIKSESSNFDMTMVGVFDGWSKISNYCNIILNNDCFKSAKNTIKGSLFSVFAQSKYIIITI